MEELAGTLLAIVLTIGLVALIIGIIKALIRNARNTPTWKGIIISAILGLLGFYLILCFFGVMGEERNRYDRL